MKKGILSVVIMLATIGMFVFSNNTCHDSTNQGQVNLERLFFKDNRISSLLAKSYIIKDSIYVDFNKDSFIDFAIVLEDTTCTAPIDECRTQYKNKKLLIFLNIDNVDVELITDLTELFESDYKEVNWGINGNDAFSELKSDDSCLVLVFDSGETLRLNEEYHFFLNSKKWQLQQYRLKEYDIMDVNSKGIVQNIYVCDYNFSKNVLVKYNIKNGTPSDSIVNSIKLNQVYLNEFNGWLGVVEK